MSCLSNLAQVFLRSFTACLAGTALGSVPLEEPEAPPPPPSLSQPTLLVLVGAPGEPEFGDLFREQALDWMDAAEAGGLHFEWIGWGQPTPDAEAESGETDETHETHVTDEAQETIAADPVPALEQLQTWLADQPTDGNLPLWLVCIGHGTFDGRVARFNLEGPDLTPDQLAAWLAPFSRPVAIVQTASASSPFLAPLSRTNRVILTATRSGYELNFTRFGLFLASAFLNDEADLDKDGQVSLLEAFLHASQQVTEFYQTEGRLQTEHALLDDNGDGLGTPADWFVGLRAVKQAQGGKARDGLRAHQWHMIPSEAERMLSPEQREQRDQLEQAVFALREKRDTLEETEYWNTLESLLLDLAEIYHPNPPPQ